MELGLVELNLVGQGTYQTNKGAEPFKVFAGTSSDGNSFLGWTFYVGSMWTSYANRIEAVQRAFDIYQKSLMI